jgi:CheY-like chemotaxis protein
MDAPKLQILHVDDEEANRLLLARRLTQTGFQVTAVEGGREALEALKTMVFDLILLDLQMPDMDGKATLTKIKADSALQTIPVLMLTASSAKEDVLECLELGACDYLIKPVHPAELKRRLERQRDFVRESAKTPL